MLTLGLFELTGSKSRSDCSNSIMYVMIDSFRFCEKLNPVSRKEILAQLEKEERLEKLEETFQNVREDYQRLLAMI